MDNGEDQSQNKKKTRHGKRSNKKPRGAENAGVATDGLIAGGDARQSRHTDRVIRDLDEGASNDLRTNRTAVPHPKRSSYTRLQRSIGQGDSPLPRNQLYTWEGQDMSPRQGYGNNFSSPRKPNSNQPYNEFDNYNPQRQSPVDFYQGQLSSPNNGRDQRSNSRGHRHGNNLFDEGYNAPKGQSPYTQSQNNRDFNRSNSPGNLNIGHNTQKYQQYSPNVNRQYSNPDGRYSPRQNNQSHRDNRSHDSQRSQHTGPGKYNNRKQHQAVKFEKYWSREDLSAGLKRKELIEGAIRINPKNYEDAYVPLPDGSGDIYISGMQNRNRALNGDIVALQILHRDNWRVYENDLENYENSLKSQPKADSDNKGGNSSDSSDDSGPDVVIESEEIIEKTKNMDISNAGDAKCGQKLNNLDVNATAAKSIKKEGVMTAVENSNNNNSTSAIAKNTRTPGGDKKKYMSVKDAVEGGSHIVKGLLQTDSGNKQNDKFVQRVAKVVGILERKHSRAASGHIKLLQDKNKDIAFFSPFDHRLPRIHIPMSECPKDFYERPDDHASTIFIARIIEWQETSQYALGQLMRSLGEAGLIEPETEALLIENDVDFSEFSDEAIDCLPKNLPWKIPEKEYKIRRDFRNECVFTIDPATARDLDDAVSCKSLGNDLYEVGVHIADVSYFIQEKSELDKVASERATSVYLTQKVIPMLPRLLCEKLCSLNPDEDRLTFSVCWKMNLKGEILEEWFGRSVIKSCVKLSYNHAQGFIDDPDKDWTNEELPPISEGFSVEDIKSRTLILHKISCCLRKARFDQGALRLDQVKLQFTLDKDTGLPNGYTVYQQRESNRLIEEYMLLANMAVAHKINSSYPEKATLRCHPPPQTKMIDDLKKTCEELGVEMNVSSALAIQQSIVRYIGNDEFTIARLQVLVALCSKPMQNAKYFCAGMYNDEANYHHYALNVPLYTHFTSPIRRYPDIMVHRLLAASLGYCAEPSKDKETLHKMADHCNDKKNNAKKCSEISNDIFFSVFVKEAGPFDERGMVMAVLDRSFDVFILKLGVVKRVYCDKLQLKDKIFEKGAKVPKLTLFWPVTEDNPEVTRQEISIFSLVNCVLKADLEPLKWTAYIKRPMD